MINGLIGGISSHRGPLADIMMVPLLCKGSDTGNYASKIQVWEQLSVEMSIISAVDKQIMD